MPPRSLSIGVFAPTARKRRLCPQCKPGPSFTNSLTTSHTNKSWMRFLKIKRRERNKSMSETKKSGGLAGVVAGQTSVSTVGKEGLGLTYRGYSINDLAENSTFEEVAYL